MNKYMITVLMTLLFFCPTHADEDKANLQESIQLMLDRGQSGTIYKSTISSIRVWLDINSDDRIMHFYLTDRSKWHTAGRDSFIIAMTANWTIGDPVTIMFNENTGLWEAFNHTRKTTVNLLQE